VLGHRSLPFEPTDPVDPIDIELAALTRIYRGVVEKFWLERLGAVLDEVPATAVRESRCGFCGDRLSILLDNGAMVKMKLLWPNRERLAALISLRWRNGVGWVLRARSTAGEAITYYGWTATVTGLVTGPGTPT
jgi:hypothetical protein